MGCRTSGVTVQVNPVVALNRTWCAAVSVLVKAIVSPVLMVRFMGTKPEAVTVIVCVAAAAGPAASAGTPTTTNDPLATQRGGARARVS